MGIFRHRPLAAALALFLAVSFGIALLSVSGVTVPLGGRGATAVLAAIAFLLLAVAVGLLVLAVKAPHRRISFVLTALTLLIVLLGAVRSGAHFFVRYTEAQHFVGERVTVTLTVREKEISIPGCVRYCAEVTEITEQNGERASLRGFDAVVLFEGIVEYGEGDCLTVEAVGIPLTELYEAAATPISNGCLVGFEVLTEEGAFPDDTSSEAGEPFVVTVHSLASEREKSPSERVLSLLSGPRTRLSFTLRETLGGKVGALSAAVLLGDRSGLDGSVSRNFERAGISHLLAISGLHMTVLIGGIAFLLRRLRFPRLISALGTLASIVFFLFLTEFPLSACRAGLMLSIAAIVFAFARRPDPITSLFLAVSALVFLDPAAVLSTGLWMSFSSVLGLLVLSGRWEAYLRVRLERPTPRGALGLLRRLAVRCVIFVLSGVGVSLIASFSILPVLWATGSEFAICAFLTNLLTVSLMTPFLILSVVLLAVFRLGVFGPMTVTVLRSIGGWIVSVATWVSSLEGATVSLSYPFAWASVLFFTVPTLVLLVVPVRVFRNAVRRLRGERTRTGGRERPIRLRWMLAPPLAAVLIYSACYFGYSARLSAITSLPATVTDASSGEMLVVSDGSRGILFDLSDGRFLGYSNARSAASTRGVTEWTAVVLTHYHSRQGASLARFCSEEIVRTVYLPMPLTEGDAAVLTVIRSRLDAVGASYAFYDRGRVLSLPSIEIFVSVPAYLERSAQPIYYLSVTRRGTVLTYLTQSAAESELSVDAWERASVSTYLVYGSDGPKPRAVFRIPTENERLKSVLTYGDGVPACLSPISVRELENGRGAVWVHGAVTADLYAPQDAETEPSGETDS